MDTLRTNWLNPPDWTRTEVLEFPGSADGPWRRYVHDVDPARGVGIVRYPRTVPKNADCAEKLKKRTLTNLYNERPAWLADAHRKLDEAAFATVAALRLRTARCAGRVQRAGLRSVGVDCAGFGRGGTHRGITPMAEAQAEEPCPFCGRHVSPTAQDCPHCGEALFEDEEEREPQPRRGRAEPTVQPTEFLLPTDVSGYSIAACYFGLLGFCFPVVGLVLAIPAFICGIVALRQRKKRSSYGSVTSDIRAVIGLIFSSLAILIWGGVLIAILVAEARR